MIPPQELKNKSFTRAGKGYDMAEVDEYIDFIIEKYSEIFAQCDKYDKKLRIVSSRISEIQSEEETIRKLSISTQKHCDRLIDEAEETAREKILNAQETAEKIIDEARNKAQTVFSMMENKVSLQIEATQKKSDELLMSARMRCTKLLGDFRKEISIQRKHIIDIKNIAEEFNSRLLSMYKNHLSLLTENTYIPSIDLGNYTESALFDSVMQEIKNDAVEIARKTSGVEYDFEKELDILKDGRNSIYNDMQKESDETDDYNTDDDYDDDDEDIKVFAKNTSSTNANANDAYSEKPRATYDSDDYDENEEEESENEDEEYDDGEEDDDYEEIDGEGMYDDNDDAGGDVNYDENYGGYEKYSDDSDDSDDTGDETGYDDDGDLDEEPEPESKGFFGLFKKKKKKESKKKYALVGDDESDDNEDEVMDIFEDLDDE